MDLKILTDRLVETYIGYKGGPFVILADETSMHIAQSIERSAKAFAGAHVNILDIAHWRAGAPLENLTTTVRQELDTLLTDTTGENTILYINESLPEEGGFRKDLIAYAAAKGKIGGLPGCTVDVLIAGYHPDNKPEFTEELFEVLKSENALRITCPLGTDLQVTYDHSKYTLVNSNGILVPGKYGNPIPAEIFTYPANVEGIAVVSGSYSQLARHPRFVGKHALLRDTLNRTPIIFEINDGSVSSIACDDSEIRTFVEKYVFEVDPANGRKIGEWGMPANLYALCRETTGNLLIDEKGRPHLGHGDGYKSRTGCEYESIVHGDGLIEKATVQAGSGAVLMHNGLYTRQSFKTLN
jgi:hypothetical protein